MGISQRGRPGPRISFRLQDAHRGQGEGLAAGKGNVLICESREEVAAVRDMLAGSSFGESGKEVVIEEFLEGEEASLHLICSGESYVALPMSQDHKKVGEGDVGLNTGGMGAYAPTRLVTPEMLAEYEESIVRPTLAGLKAEGIEFRGTLYVGLMLTNAGPKVLEFNARFGDPETQVILPLLDDDLVPLLLASARGEELPDSVRFKEAYAMVVVLASAGYPEKLPERRSDFHPFRFPRGLPTHSCGHEARRGGEMRNRRGSGPGCGGHGLEPAGSKGKSECSVRFSRFPSKYFRRDIGHREFSRD